MSGGAGFLSSTVFPSPKKFLRGKGLGQKKVITIFKSPMKRMEKQAVMVMFYFPNWYKPCKPTYIYKHIYIYVHICTR